jgi:hypothetical protein
VNQLFFRTIISTAMLLPLFSFVPSCRLHAQANDTLPMTPSPLPDTVTPGMTVPTDSPDSSSGAASVSVDTPLTATRAASPVTTDENPTADPEENDVAPEALPITTSIPIDSQQVPTSPSRQQPSGYYQGYAPVNPGIRRGMSSSGTSVKSGRKLLLSTDTASPALIDTSVLLHRDSSSRVSAAVTDTSAGAPDSGAAVPASFTKLSRRAKIIAAVGTSAAIIGVTAFILVKKYSGEKDTKDEGIPDPPDPPGYW